MIQISDIWKIRRTKKRFVQNLRSQRSQLTPTRQAQQAVHQAEVAHLTTKYEKVKLAVGDAMLVLLF